MRQLTEGTRGFQCTFTSSIKLNISSHRQALISKILFKLSQTERHWLSARGQIDESSNIA